MIELETLSNDDTKLDSTNVINCVALQLGTLYEN